MRFGACAGTLVFSLAATLAFSVQAVELGEEQVYSFLNEPFLAEIELNDWRDVGIDRIRIELASPQDFQNFNLPYLPELEDLEFSVEQTSSGNAYIQVSGRRPLNEPYLDFLLRARWPGGTVLREYVVLLDIPGTGPESMPEKPVATATQQPVYVPEPRPLTQPPVTGQEQSVARSPITDSASRPGVPETRTGPGGSENGSAVVVAPLPVSEPALVQAESARSSREVTPEPRVAVNASSPVVPRSAETDPQPPASVRNQVQRAPQEQRSASVVRSYRVQPGDSLWEIARANRSGDLTIYQVMVGIYEQNINSFVNRNITLLKINQNLDVPDASVMAGLSASEARRVFDQLAENGQARVEALKLGLPLPEFTDFPVPLEQPVSPATDEQVVEPSGVTALEQPPASDNDGLMTPFTSQTAISVAGPEEEEIAAAVLPEETLPEEEEQVGALEQMLAERQEEIRTLEEQMSSMSEQLRAAEANIQRLLDAAESTPVVDQASAVTDVAAPGTSGPLPEATEVQADNAFLLKVSVGVLALMLVLSTAYIWRLKRRENNAYWDDFEDMDLPDDFEIDDVDEVQGDPDEPSIAVEDAQEEGDYLAIVDLPEEGFGEDDYYHEDDADDDAREVTKRHRDELPRAVDRENHQALDLPAGEVEIPEPGGSDPGRKQDSDIA